MIELLPQEHWHELSSVFEGEFKTAMPDPRYSHIISATQDDELLGFGVLEHAVWLSELYVAPKHRGSSTAFRLLDYMERRVPEGKSILCTPDDERLEKWCRRRRLYQINGKLYRKAAGR